MFYKQSIDDIKLVILSLDGGLLDLNRLRFNYLKKICKSHDITITKEEFEKSLGNMETMYINLPIANDIVPDDLNKLIEHDLYEYAKLKPNSLIKEGTEDLLQFFKQKNIKIAVISTHKIKRAIQYLQLTRLYNYIDFVIGGDNNNLPLPDPSVLTITLEQLGVASNNALVIANYPNLLYAANRKFMNVIYLNDLCPATNSIISSAFKIAKNNLDVINIMLFARYDTMEMYSPLLGMSSDMPLPALKQTYKRLLKEYENDEQLIDLVNNTYQYFLNEILKKDSSTISSIFEEENKDTKKTNKSVDTNKIINETASNESNSKELVDHFEFNDIPEKTIHKKPTIKDDPEHINELMDIINGHSNQPIETENEINELKTTKQEKKSFDSFLHFLYTLAVVALVSFIGLLVFVAFQDFINGPSVIASIIKKIIDIYVNIVLSIYTFIFNGLHHIISFIPDYNHLIMSNDFLSSLAIKLILFIIFNLIIVYVFKFGLSLLNEVEDEDELTEEN